MQFNSLSKDDKLLELDISGIGLENNRRVIVSQDSSRSRDKGNNLDFDEEQEEMNIIMKMMTK